MPRVENLSAITSMALLIAGVLLPHFAPNSGWSMTWRGTGYGFSYQMPCYGIASLFGVFAFLYSIGYIPFDKTVAQWHFWLSLGSVILCAAEWTIFSILVTRNTLSSQLSVFGTFAVLSFFSSILFFVCAVVVCGRPDSRSSKNAFGITR